MPSPHLPGECKGHRMFSLRYQTYCQVLTTSFGVPCHVKEARDKIPVTHRQGSNDTNTLLSPGGFSSPFCPLLVQDSKGPKGFGVFQHNQPSGTNLLAHR